MIGMSDTYYVNVDKTIREPFIPTVILSSADPTLIEKTSFDSLSEQLPFSRQNQLFNQIVNPSWGLQTFEPGRTKANGNFVIFDDTTGGEFGWWSKAVCDENGNFSEPQTIKLVYSENLTFFEFSIFFDFWAKEYATDFEITFYDSNNAIVSQRHVTDNNSYSYQIEEQLYFVRSVELKINKWSIGNRYAKVSEMLSGFVMFFDSDTVFGISFTENLSIFEKEIISSEIRVTVENFDQQFNINNPTGIAKKLDMKQPFNVSLSLEGENVQLALMYLLEQKTEQRNTITFVCRSIFDFIEEDYIPASHERVSAYSLFETLFQKIGISDYSIVSSLENVMVNQYAEGLTLRQAVQQLANAVRCVVFTNRNGTVSVDTIDSLLIHTKQYVHLDQNVTSDPPETDKLKTIDSVTVTTYQYTVDNETGLTDIVKDYKVSIDNDFAQTEYYIDYKQIATQVTATVTGLTVVGDIQYFADRCKIVFSGIGEATVNIKGIPVIQKKGKLNLKSDRYYNNPVKEDTPVENQFISLASQGRLLAEAMMKMSEFRIYNEIYERGRPDLEAGDMIEIENEFGIIRDGLIFEQNIQFDSNGFLEGFMKVYGRGS